MEDAQEKGWVEVNRALVFRVQSRGKPSSPEGGWEGEKRKVDMGRGRSGEGGEGERDNRGEDCLDLRFLPQEAPPGVQRDVYIVTSASVKIR